MFRFAIAGLKTGADGKTNAILTITLVDAAGKEVLNQAKPVQAVVPYGIDACPGTASLIVGATAIPGDYSLRVSVEDKLAVGSARFVRRVTVKPAAFRVLNPRCFVDPALTLPGPCGGFPGQTLYLRVQAADP